MSRALLDVNVLIALLDPFHIQHQIAQDWFLSESKKGWASCPITENGFVRIVSQSSYPHPVSIPDAIATLSALMRETDHQFWPDVISLFDVDAKYFTAERLLTPRQITDSYLLGLAAHQNGVLATLDRRLICDAVPSSKKHLLIIG